MTTPEPPNTGHLVIFDTHVRSFPIDLNAAMDKYACRDIITWLSEKANSSGIVPLNLMVTVTNDRDPKWDRFIASSGSCVASADTADGAIAALREQLPCHAQDIRDKIARLSDELTAMEKAKAGAR